nr:DNA binding protein [Microvirus sp.]CAI9751521.1 DNA binding protein [Microvirus sp.]
MSIFSKRSEKGEKYIKQKYGVDAAPLPSDYKAEFLYSIYDSVCEEYNPPFVCKNMATAIRNMRDSLKDAKNSIIAMHPEDYVLVQVGTFDKTTGYPLSLIGEDRLSYPLSKLFVKEEIKQDEVQNK